MGKLIASGRAFFSQKHLGETDAVIDRFVFANIEGLDINAEINDAEVLPDAGNIVWQGALSKEGYISNDHIVYSVQLDPTVGDFEFNWMGLLTSDDTLIAVDYVPLQPKVKTSENTRGNNLARNMMISYVDAKNIVQLTIPAETWQYDQTNLYKNLQLEIIKLNTATITALCSNMMQEERIVKLEAKL